MPYVIRASRSLHGMPIMEPPERPVSTYFRTPPDLSGSYPDEDSARAAIAQCMEHYMGDDLGTLVGLRLVAVPDIPHLP